MHTSQLCGDEQAPDLLAMLGGTSSPRICASPGCDNLTEGVRSGPSTYIDGPEGRQVIPAPLVYLSAYCETCVWTIRAEESSKAKHASNSINAKRRGDFWQKIWGGPESLYHSTVFEQLPDRASAEKVGRWKMQNPKGILCHGQTGTGKTRSVYLLLKKLLFEHGIYPEFRKCVQLRHDISKAAMSETPGARDDLIAKLVNARILFLDDLGQMANTPASEEALLQIVEERTQRGRPIIATTQLTGERFAELFKSKERGQAIGRRLTESCYLVPFTAPAKQLVQEEIPLS